MRIRAIERLMLGYGLLFGLLLVDTLLWPTKQVDAYGISYYLVHLDTFVILTLGFIGCVVALLLEARDLPGDGLERLLRWSFRAMAGLLVAIMITPYTWNTFFNWAHMTVGAMLFVLQLALSIWLTIRYLPRKVLNWAMILLQFVGGLLAMWSLPDNGINLLIQGEVIFQAGFTLLLLYSMSHLIVETEAEAPAQTSWHHLGRTT
jgi:FtsH-binding integral membrane protein